MARIDFLLMFVLAVCVLTVGVWLGAISGVDLTEKKLGSAICKKLNGNFARLDGEPICLNAAGGVLKFYD